MADYNELSIQETNLRKAYEGQMNAHYYVELHPKKGKWAGCFFFTQPDEQLPEFMMTSEFMDTLSPTTDYAGVLEKHLVYEALFHTWSELGKIVLSDLDSPPASE